MTRYEIGDSFSMKPPEDSMNLAAPDNDADRTIMLAISGNRLVSVLNALDQAMHETERYHFEGDNVVASSPWYGELRKTTEAIRDELSRQRCAPLAA